MFGVFNRSASSVSKFFLYRIDPFSQGHKNSFDRVTSQIHTDPKYLDRHARAISVDPDQTWQQRASDQCLHCLPFI